MHFMIHKISFALEYIDADAFTDQSLLR